MELTFCEKVYTREDILERLKISKTGKMAGKRDSRVVETQRSVRGGFLGTV